MWFRSEARLRGFAGIERAEFTRDEFDQMRVLNMARRGDQHIFRDVALLVSFQYGRARKIANRFRRSEDRAAERVTAPEILHHQFVHNGFGVVLIHFYFFQDDLFLTANFFRIEKRTQCEIGKNFPRHGQMFVENLGVERNHFFGGVCVHHAADGIDRARDGFGAAALCAFENHMLGEMRDAVARRGFASRAGAQPDAHGNGTDVLHRLGDNDQAVGQNFPMNYALFAHLMQWKTRMWVRTRSF